MRRRRSSRKKREERGRRGRHPDSSLATNNSNTPAAAIPIRARSCPLEMPIKILSVSYVKELNSEKGSRRPDSDKFKATLDRASEAGGTVASVAEGQRALGPSWVAEEAGDWRRGSLSLLNSTRQRY